MKYLRPSQLLNYWPNFCLICHLTIHATHALCDNCYTLLPRYPNSHCNLCDQPLYTQLSIPTPNHHAEQSATTYSPNLCMKCKKKGPFDTSCILWHYQGWVQQAMLTLKHTPNKPMMRFFSQQLVHMIQNFYQQQSWPQAAITVPQHRQRTRLRGYHPCLIILRTTLKKLPAIKNQSHHIKQIKPQAYQHRLNKKQRQQRKIHHYLECSQPLANHIAIFDDVWTTGTTARTLAEFCLNHGAKQVDIWCLSKQCRRIL